MQREILIRDVPVTPKISFGQDTEEGILPHLSETKNL